MTPRRWPSNIDYVQAVQDVEWCFADGELRRGEIEEGSVIGVPKCATGQNAIIFPIICEDRSWAVRCFTTPPLEGRRRYDAYGSYLSSRHCPPLVEAHWIEAGIRTDADWWPIVKMEWIEGDNLLEVARKSAEQPRQLGELADQWRRTVRWLRHAKIAHGDLQHGNVLVDGDGSLRLVDYDGIWIPDLAEAPNREVGHPNYQHPERLATGYCDEYVDTFSALVIYTSLRALAADPTLWKLNNGENFVLTAADYVEPGMADAWRQLAASSDPEVVKLSRLVSDFCRHTVRVPTDLDEILDTGRLPESISYRPSKRAPKWWEPDYEEANERYESPVGDVNATWSEPIQELDDPGDEADGHISTDDEGSRDWRVIVIVALLLMALTAASITIVIAARH
jgi:serine/threonine protein kinase